MDESMLEQDTAQPAAATVAYQQLLEQAITSYRAGELPQAEQYYRQILLAYPQDPVAKHNLGILAIQLHGAEVGLLHLKAALEASPDHGQYWLSYIDALMQAGRLDAARQVLQQGRARGLQGDAVDLQEQRLLVAQQASGQPVAPQQAAYGAHGGSSSKTTVNHPATPQGKQSKRQKKQQSRQPDSQMLASLEVTFNAARYAEAEVIARQMTGQFPQFGFGWLAFGVILQELGRKQEALVAKRRAAELLPENAEAHSNLALSLYEQGYLTEAEASCRRALALRPDFPEAYCNLAATLLTLGRFGEAEASARHAITLKPDCLNALVNLGNALLGEGKLGEAEHHCRHAIHLNPDFADAYNILGNCLVKQARLQEAEISYHRAIELGPYANADFHNSLGTLLLYTGDLVQAASAYQNALAIDPSGAGLKSAVWLATLHFLANNRDTCRNMLIAAWPIFDKTDAVSRIARIYCKFLHGILTWWQEHPASLPDVGTTLHVIGESHSLPVHGVQISYRGQTMQCASQWIPGCKQWHLGNSQPNRYKHRFERIMQALPRPSTVLLLIGEIDCRPGEGILHVWRKNKDKPLGDVALTTVQRYVSYVAGIAALYRHNVVISGLPALKFADELVPADAEQLADLIRIFNAFLKDAAYAAGMDFLDTYALTNRGDGIANGQWHIDAHHLLPSAIPEAFKTHLVQCDAMAP